MSAIITQYMSAKVHNKSLLKNNYLIVEHVVLYFQTLRISQNDGPGLVRQFPYCVTRNSSY